MYSTQSAMFTEKRRKEKRRVEYSSEVGRGGEEMRSEEKYVIVRCEREDLL